MISKKPKARNNVMLGIFLTIAISLSVSFVGYVVFRSLISSAPQPAATGSSTQHSSAAAMLITQ
jgi:hypothetical protein